ncbi:hypothetical protein [Acinetobacter sp. NIPH 2699]|uniref:hypothetical protein n=1 Tax=Acinetobacter sp. NIPH 2699 TaxID=2923433 RepID=UPI001F4AA635|nr:hypothetical protein [Acinetobacter sp. NIPH 2699]
MNKFKIMMIASFLSIPLLISGCSSGLDPNRFEVNLAEENNPSFMGRGFGLIDNVLTIRSIDSAPISVTKVDVNNGRCSYTKQFDREIKFPQHFQIGQSLRLYLKCPFNSVVKVDIETDQGAASYSFK